MELTRQDRMLGGLFGLAVGDALGVPVEFSSRAERARDPVREMRGHGTHRQPAGTWSDDTSLALCTIDALLAHGDDCEAAGRRFVRWLREGLWAAHGEVFDVGGTTRAAIERIERGARASEAGGPRGADNGNGSLMRILPVALWFERDGVASMLDASHRYSAITHRHATSLVACGIFCQVARALLSGSPVGDATAAAWDEARRAYVIPPFREELERFSWIGDGRIHRDPPPEAECRGYVVGSLRAALWALTSTGTFEDAVFAAVDLGGDTDTNGAITGSLAGLAYGVDSIPSAWRTALARVDDLGELFARFIRRACQ